MFIFLSKLIPTIIYPVGLAGLVLLVSLVLKKEKLRRRLVFFAAAVLWLGGNRWVSGALTQALEWQYLPPESIPKAEVIVVLGGGTYPAEYPRPTVEVGQAGDRVLYGARLYLEGYAPLVVVTGGNLPWSSGEANDAQNMSELLSFLGIPEDAVLLEEESDNTYENAVFTRDILEPMGIKQIILVTSASHMPRSVAIFEKQGFDVIPAPTDFSVTASSTERPLSETWPEYFLGLFPSASNLDSTTRALKEYLGLFIYRLRGWA